MATTMIMLKLSIVLLLLSVLPLAAQTREETIGILTGGSSCSWYAPSVTVNGVRKTEFMMLRLKVDGTLEKRAGLGTMGMVGTWRLLEDGRGIILVAGARGRADGGDTMRTVIESISESRLMLLYHRGGDQLRVSYGRDSADAIRAIEMMASVPDSGSGLGMISGAPSVPASKKQPASIVRPKALEKEDSLGGAPEQRRQAPVRTTLRRDGRRGTETWRPIVSTDEKSTFEDCWQRFQSGAAANDMEKIASVVHFPFRSPELVSMAKLAEREYSDMSREEFMEHASLLFNAEVRAAIADAIPTKDANPNDGELTAFSILVGQYEGARIKLTFALDGDGRWKLWGSESVSYQ